MCVCVPDPNGAPVPHALLQFDQPTAHERLAWARIAAYELLAHYRSDKTFACTEHFCGQNGALMAAQRQVEAAKWAAADDAVAVVAEMLRAHCPGARHVSAEGMHEWAQSILALSDFHRAQALVLMFASCSLLDDADVKAATMHELLNSFALKRFSQPSAFAALLCVHSCPTAIRYDDALSYFDALQAPDRPHSYVEAAQLTAVTSAAQQCLLSLHALLPDVFPSTEAVVPDGVMLHSTINALADAEAEGICVLSSLSAAYPEWAANVHVLCKALTGYDGPSSFLAAWR